MAFLPSLSSISTSSKLALLGILAGCVLLACLSVQELISPPKLGAQINGGKLRRSDFTSDLVFGASTAAAQIEGSTRVGGKGFPDSKTPYQFDPNELNVKRSNFASDFVFGGATAAAQIEGSPKEGGRGPSVWDYFVEKYPERVIDGSNMNIAIDSYKRYKEDVKALKDLGLDAYRFSISWSRILPDGSLSGGVNQEGINHYNSLIDELLKQRIKPFVTIFHFDLPQALQDKYGGPLNHSFVDDFKDYAEICFKTFGDRVKDWITINEPLIIAKFGHDIGYPAPPSRCSDRNMCPAGNSSTEPYIVTHNLLLAHATAVKLYREKFQSKQGGQIGISLLGQYIEPYSNDSADDQAAAKRVLDFELGWFLEPIVFGDYPQIMKQLVKDRLPSFKNEEKTLVKGSSDFIGINYYTTRYAKNIPMNSQAPPISFRADEFANVTEDKDGVFIGPKAEGSQFVYIYPEGLEKLVLFLHKFYKNPKIYITENGITEMRDDSIPVDVVLKDQHRINYVSRHLYRLHRAIGMGVNIKGYFYWSVFDDLEWGEGFTARFGLYYTDYSNNLTRIPKQSAKWLHDFLNDRKN